MLHPRGSRLPLALASAQPDCDGEASLAGQRCLVFCKKSGDHTLPINSFVPTSLILEADLMCLLRIAAAALWLAPVLCQLQATTHSINKTNHWVTCEITVSNTQPRVMQEMVLPLPLSGSQERRQQSYGTLRISNSR